MLEAARTSTVVRFEHVKAGSGEPMVRTVEPWGVLSWRRRWYVAGLDRDRGEPRSFRLSRITGPVRTVGGPGAFDRPRDVDLVAMVANVSWDDRTARIRVAGRGAGELRRLAGTSEPEAGDDGTAVLSINYSDTAWLARTVAAAGSAAVVLEPPELVAAVVERLSAARGVPVGGRV